MQRNSLAAWLDRLENLHPTAIDLGLDRLRAVADRANLATFDCPTLLVGGTNGKGSTVAMLAAIYEAAGYQVATSTSPHLLDFRERLLIQHHMLSEAQWCEAFEFIDNLRKEITLTYFEFTTLAAFYLLQQCTELDLIILEVGMGGRLDAMNLVDANLAVITSVDLDHTAFLGCTREAIGFEKAGIFRSGHPAVYAEENPPLSVLAHAEKLKVPLFCLGRDYHYDIHPNSWTWWNDAYREENLPLPHLPLQNAAAVREVVALMKTQLPVESVHISQGLRKAFVPGRFQIIEHEKATTILDVGHNPHAGRYLAKRLSDYAAGRRCVAVVAMQNTKDIAGTLAPFEGLIKAWYCARFDHPYAVLPHTLAQALPAGAVHDCFDTVLAAYQAALTESSAKDIVLVFGSFYTVSEILKQGSC